MTRAPLLASAATTALLGLALPAQADQVIADDLIVTGDICVGAIGCVSGEVFGDNDIKIKSYLPELQFFDTTAGDSSWTVSVDDPTSGISNGFTIKNETNGDYPFLIEEDAPTRALFVAGSGNIGFGTSLPQRDLHVTSGNYPGLRLEQDTSGGFGNHTWDILSGNSGLLFNDVGSIFSTTPFAIQNGARHSGLILASNGNTGMGTATPAAALHLHRNQGDAQMLIEEVNATANPRTLLNLQNNGRPEIVMGNTATNGEWSFGAGTDFFLKTGTVGSVSNAKTKVFTVKQNGDVIVAGTLTTGGTTCGGGCDRVFTEHAILPQSAYAAAMWADGYLPHVGPTPEGAPLNVSEKLGGMLNALEHAHVFIDRQQAEIAALRAELDALKAEIAGRN